MLNTILKYLNLSNDKDLILPNLYLGNETSSLNTNFLKENNIKLIVNCSKDLKFNQDYKCDKVRIPIDDNKFFKNNEIFDYLNIVEKIHEYRKKKKNILIHCRIGSQRSATILLYYLIVKLDFSYSEGISIIKKKRPICFYPINNFYYVFANDNLTFS